MEHHSNIVPWHFLRERQGAVIKWAPVDDEGNFLIDEFEKLLTPRTKLVAITQMSNALGTVVPVKDVVKLAHARGIPVLVDGSQAAVHLDVDVQDIDCDFYVFTGHKLYGPTGIGVLYAKHDHLVAMRPYQRRRRDDPRSGAGPRHLWRPAAQVRGGHAGDRRGDRARRGDRLRQFDRQGAHRRARARSADLRRRTGCARSIRCGSSAPREDKGPVISFEMKGAHPHDVATVIDRQGIAVRAGTHCVMPLLERFDVTATCRASFGMYNTREEVDHLAQALIKARELFS